VRLAFVLRLRSRLSVRARLATLLEEQYAALLLAASSDEAIGAAIWAAERLQEVFRPAELERITSRELAISLAEGCPLCAYESRMASAEQGPKAPLATL